MPRLIHRSFVVLFVALGSLVTSSCVTHRIGQGDVTVTNSNFDRNITYVAPAITHSEFTGASFTSYSTRLAGAKDKQNGVLTYAIYTTLTYSGMDWCFFNSVSFLGGVQLPPTVSDRTVDSCMSTGCVYHEEFGFIITEGLLEQAAKTGLSLRYNAQRCPAVIIEYPASYVAQYLNSPSVAHARQGAVSASQQLTAPVQKPANQLVSQPNTPTKSGKRSYTVEQLPEARACNPYPVAILTVQGAGVEHYSVQCSGGDVLSVRCESIGECRVLK